jgi:hypothetical protein
MWVDRRSIWHHLETAKALNKTTLRCMRRRTLQFLLHFAQDGPSADI